MDNTTDNKKKYWQSLDQWRGSSQFEGVVDKEFNASPLSEESQNGWARRDFLKLMGASLALGSFGCVRRPIQKIVPYVKRPEGMVPGVSNFYASSLYESGEVFSLVVRTREGRPIKLEGNELFPGSGQSLSARGHAHLLSLYDPERLTGPIQNLLNKTRSNKDSITKKWDDIDKLMGGLLDNQGVYVLSGANPSRSSRKLIESFVSKFGGEYFEWSPLSYDAFKKSFKDLGGETTSLPQYKISKSNYILSIGTDFLGAEYGSLQLSREWGERRDVSKGEPVKLVQVESLMTMTGANADQRVILKPSEYLSFLCAVISNLGAESIYATQASAYAGIKHLSEEAKVQAAAIAMALKGNAQKSLVLSHGTQALSADYSEIQKATHFINGFLENDGKTIDYSKNPYVSYRGEAASLEKLRAAIKAGKVKTLLIHDANPLYSYEDAEGFKELLKEVKTVIYTGDRNNETGAVSHYILPDDHSLEKWGEFESTKNVFTVAQPTIAPLYDTRAFEQSLLKWMGKDSTWYDLVKETWKNRYNLHKSSAKASNFQDFWVNLLQNGVWDLSSEGASPVRTFTGVFRAAYKAQTSQELIVYPSIGLGDGKLANVSWMQEFPDPVTKIVWDNYLSVSLEYAELHGLKRGSVVEVFDGDSKVELPVHIQPGQDSGTFGVALGYGRVGAGKVCKDVGVNVYPFIQKGAFSGLAVQLKKTTKKTDLVTTQEHNSMEGRAIVAETSYNEYKANEGSGIHKHKIISLWSKHKYTGHKWGMSVDLSKCTGCSACIVACQSENNIPVVGKKHVLNGREMHWIRLDRYYVGDPKSPRTVHQPVMCMHCDNAPCETVCPVLATVHSSEGLNDMSYNRCVGTRYCANNCPYKVRRFNWFNYSKVESPLNMALNPEVTVRPRGVMEKCTFCVHKINQGKSQAALEDRKLEDGEISTACEMTCPTKALVFGDMNDKSSRVSKDFAEKRSYQLLEELNVVPSVRYMTKIWNSDSKISEDHSGGHDNKDHDPDHKDNSHSKKGEAHS